MSRIAIVTTHPIQYNAPLFTYLAKSDYFKIKVFYTWGQSQESIYDLLFLNNRIWDIPLLEGYDYTFSKNISSNPGSHHFSGIDNPTLISDLESFSPDAIILFGWAFRSHLKVLRYFKGKVPILFRGDSIIDDQSANFKIGQFVRKLFLKWVYQHIDYALYVGKRNKEYFLQSGIKNNQLFFAPHAVDNERFQQISHLDESVRYSFRTEYNIPSGDIIYAYVGKLYSLKDVDLLIDAFMKVEFKESWLVIVGTGDMEDYLIRRARVNDRVIFLGFKNQSELPAIYHSVDVIVLPSKSETWGLVINEAMASGKAVIVSDKCGCAVDLVNEGQNGFVFQSGNKEDLVSKMNLISDKSTALKMGEESRSIIAEYSYENISVAIKSCLDKHEKLT
jgi:glycosyltransferase involved in cell wall biosynthesis